MRRTRWIFLLILALQSVAFAIAPAGSERAQTFEATSLSPKAQDCVNSSRTGETPIQDDICWQRCLACCFGPSGEGLDFDAIVTSRIAFPPPAETKALGGLHTKDLPPRAFEFTRPWSSRAPPSFS